MLTRYLERAMAHASFEGMPDGRFFAKIEECPGMWACGATREICSAELLATLEAWVTLKLRHDDHLPVIDGVDLNEQPRLFMRKGEVTTPLPDTATEDDEIEEHTLERFLAVVGIDEEQWEKLSERTETESR